MKKILLGTSGLFGAVALFAGAASAQTPTVTIGGTSNFQAGYVGDDADADQRSQGFRSDNEISIRVDGKADNGLGYGAVIDLEADVTNDTTNTASQDGVNAARTYLFLDGGWGRFEMGSNAGAAVAMSINASNIAAATGGIGGDWIYFANQPAAGGSFVFVPGSFTAHAGSLTGAAGLHQFNNSNKVTYYSPRIEGFQLGASYTPDLTDRGQIVTRNDTNNAGDIVDVALTYEGQWDEASLGLAATYQVGEAEATTNNEDLQAWTVGLSTGWAGFKLAGSYADFGDSLQAKTANADLGYWTVGAAYDFGPFGTSVTYLDGEFKSGGSTNDFTNLVLGADYSLAPGLTPYAEVSMYEYDGGANNTTADNDGTAVILGTQLAF